MAEVVITDALARQIKKKFTKIVANTIIDLLESFGKNPHKGRVLTSVSGFVIKEAKFEKWRFYCVTDGYILKFGTENELTTLLIKFVRLSKKKDQQKAIDAIKAVLKSMGFEKL